MPGLRDLIRKTIASEPVQILSQGAAQAANKAKQEAADYVASSLPNAVVKQVMEQNKPGRVARFLTNYATSPFYLLLAGGALAGGHQALTGDTRLARYVDDLKEKYHTNLEAAGNVIPPFLKRMSTELAHYPNEFVEAFEGEKKNLRRRDRVADNVYKQYKTISNWPFGDKLLDVLDRAGTIGKDKPLSLIDLLRPKEAMQKQAGIGSALLLSPFILGGLATAGAAAHKAYTGDSEWEDRLSALKAKALGAAEAGFGAAGKAFGEVAKGKNIGDMINIFRNEYDRKRTATDFALKFKNLIGGDYSKYVDKARGLIGKMHRLIPTIKQHIPEKMYRQAVGKVDQAKQWAQKQPWYQKAQPILSKAQSIMNQPIAQQALERTGIAYTPAYKRLQDLRQQANRVVYPISPTDTRTLHHRQALGF